VALIAPFYLDCVVALGFKGADGTPVYQATGFLYGKSVGTNPAGATLYRVYLATNRHVFEGEAAAFVRFNPAADGPARVYDLPLKTADGATLWIAHPQETVDVAVVPVNTSILREHNIQFGFFEEDKHTLSRTQARDAGVTEGDGVFVLGFPLGLVGGERNYVIVRSGVIARIRDALVGATTDFLIDAPIFPGNSGGPVVTKPEMTTIQGTKNLTSAYLIGIVSGYVPYRDVAISEQTKRPRVVFEENSGLAAVVPIDRVAEAAAAAESKLAPQPAAAPSEPAQ